MTEKTKEEKLHQVLKEMNEDLDRIMPKLIRVKTEDKTVLEMFEEFGKMVGYILRMNQILDFKVETPYKKKIPPIFL